MSTSPVGLVSTLEHLGDATSRNLVVSFIQKRPTIYNDPVEIIDD